MPGVNQAFSYLVLLSLYRFQKREAHFLLNYLQKNIAYHLGPTRRSRPLSAHHYPAEFHKRTAITLIVLNMKKKSHLQNI